GSEIPGGNPEGNGGNSGTSPDDGGRPSDAGAPSDAGTPSDAGSDPPDSGTPAPTYNIGGTVVGLVGGPLVLQNNGGDDLSLNANGSFSFSTKLTAGAADAVTGKAGGVPTGMGQACAVTSGAGTTGSANVTSVRVRCSFQLSGGGGGIPESTATTCTAATSGPPLNSDINVPSNYFSVGSIVISLNNLSHPFAGDLRATLTHVNTGTVVTLFDRMAALACNSGDVFFGTFRVSETFTPTFCANATIAGRVVSGGDFAPCSGNGAATSFASFAGQSVQGTWRLTFGDMEAEDVGSLGGWSITFSPP
ncbi:MAG: hypothetical protein ACT4TC_24540, partial [Myxococcaceae bacterium]